MKKRFLTAESHDDYYDVPYTRLHRNLTKEALECLDDEEIDLLDDIPSNVKCPRKHKWDGRYTTNAAKRWLKSKVGQPWHKNRQEFIEYTANKGYWMVEENTTMIDGVLHIQDMFGPRTLDEIRGDTFYVDNHGILKHKAKEKYKYPKYANRFLVYGDFVWFRRDRTLFYCVPLANVKYKSPYTYGSFFSRSLYGKGDFVFNHYEGSHRLPLQLRGGHVQKCDIKQAPKKEIPQAAYELGYLK